MTMGAQQRFERGQRAVKHPLGPFERRNRAHFAS